MALDHIAPPDPQPVTLVIATRNAHKAQEIRAIFTGKFEFRTLNDFPDAPEVVEDAPTFAENAMKKAMQIAEFLGGKLEAPSASQHKTPNAERPSPGLLVLADDSGLEVDALGGAPGVHSARFAALESGAEALPRSNTPDPENNSKLLRLLQEVCLEKRTARFRCVLALVEVRPGATLRAPHLFEGVCEGRISFAPAGKAGFGYDPLFVPLGYDRSFAELGEEAKNEISHRAKALRKLRGWLETG